MNNKTPWRHWSDLPTTETWCLIAYKWKYSKTQSRISYMVDRTIEGKAQWWGTDPVLGAFEILGWKPFDPILVAEANALKDAHE
jgi:hypothetical protein